jgi:hypothetical protein
MSGATSHHSGRLASSLSRQGPNSLGPDVRAANLNIGSFFREDGFAPFGAAPPAAGCRAHRNLAR